MFNGTFRAGALAEWLKDRPETLAFAVQFILQFVAQPELSVSATKAFKELCELAADLLAQHPIDPILEGFWQLHEGIQVGVGVLLIFCLAKRESS